MSGPYGSLNDFLLSQTEDQRVDGSEFGGVAGNPQPYPHTPTPTETLHAMYASDPTDPDVDIFTEEAVRSIHPES